MASSSAFSSLILPGPLALLSGRFWNGGRAIAEVEKTSLSAETVAGVLVFTGQAGQQVFGLASCRKVPVKFPSIDESPRPELRPLSPKAKFYDGHTVLA